MKNELEQMKVLRESMVRIASGRSRVREDSGYTIDGVPIEQVSQEDALYYAEEHKEIWLEKQIADAGGVDDGDNEEYYEKIIYGIEVGEMSAMEEQGMTDQDLF